MARLGGNADPAGSWRAGFEVRLVNPLATSVPGVGIGTALLVMAEIGGDSPAWRRPRP